jgi:hypothetical protein
VVLGLFPLTDPDEVAALVRKGAEIFEDTRLGGFILHERGIASLDGRMFDVKDAVGEMRRRGMIEREKKPRLGGHVWRLVEPKPKEGTR